MKGWGEVVSLSTHAADGYLSRLINDAYVDRLWSRCRLCGKRNSLPRKLPITPAGDDLPISRFIYGPVRVMLTAYLKRLVRAIVLYCLTTLIQ